MRRPLIPKTENLREILLDRERFPALARSFAEESARVRAEETGDAGLGEYLGQGLEVLLKENGDNVFNLTASPIETIFVNSLVLMFIKNDPLKSVRARLLSHRPSRAE